jgi:uncharacterized membrane protein
MNWKQRYAMKSYLRSALWIIPLVALVLELITIRLVSAIDVSLTWAPRLARTAAEMAGVMDTVVTLAISFIVFTFGSMLVAIQVASGQMTPRIIATALLRDNFIRFIVGLFIFSLLFAAGTKARLDEDIPLLSVAISFGLGIASITAFLFLIDYTARLLRPVAIVWRIGEQGIRVIETVYPQAVQPLHAPTPQRQKLGPSDRTVEHHGTSAVVLAANTQSLVALARSVDGIIEFVPRIGDFVAIGEPLFHLYGNATEIDDRRLRAQVAFGPERTIEQDSTFAFRVIVDVAIKALSKAINDPTTAVLAIDQLHRLLRVVGHRRLHDDALFDANGRLRLIFRTPGWEDFVHLSFREIRLYGAENFQVARRLRAMIVNLTAVLPEIHLPALHCELRLLDQALEMYFKFPEDLVLARQPDLQGLG